MHYDSQYSQHSQYSCNHDLFYYYRSVFLTYLLTYLLQSYVPISMGVDVDHGEGLKAV